jgi:tetratricopeptide (TPR) repeat protein
LSVGTGPSPALAHLWRERRSAVPSGWSALGAAHAFRGEWKAARTALSKAITRPSATTIEDHFLLSLVQDRLDEAGEASRTRERGLALLPDDAVGDELFTELALEALSRQLAGKPDAKHWARRAELLATRERWVEALADLGRARKADPDRWAEHVGVSTNLLRRAADDAVPRLDWPVAQAALIRSLELRPDADRYLWYKTAVLLAFQGDEKRYAWASAEILRRWQNTSAAD